MAASIVQQVTGGTQNDYGLTSVPFTSSDGNTLVVFAAWSTAHGVTQQGATVPAVNVTDSAGNLWYQVGISSAAIGGSRCAVWCAPAARPVSWVSVAVTAWAYATTYTVAEISGMPPLPEVDFSVTAYDVSAGSMSLSAAAAHTDVMFALLAAGDISVTVTAGPAGWTALTGSSAGTAPYGAQIWPYWIPSQGSGQVSASWTLTAAAPVSGLLIGLNTAATPPAQPDPDFPLVQLEAAFGATPGDPSTSVDYTVTAPGEAGTWTDISDRVLGNESQTAITCSAGRQYELSQEEAGTFTVSLDNHDGAFTPGNTGSPYYSDALNPNMGFEAGLEGWQNGNAASITVSSAYAYTGVFSLEVTPTGTTSATYVQSAAVPVSVSSPYSASAWFYVPGGWAGGAQVNINWLDSGGHYLSTSSGAVSAALPAATWTQAASTDVVPPAGAAQAQVVPQLAGAPPASAVFYVDEAAIVAGSSPVRTGLVTLSVPVRVTCWWQGRRYPVWAGYVERWPQTWPQLPQWGFTRMVATDAFGVLSNTVMRSAVEGEILNDQPYAYFPCNEQYAQAEEGLYTYALPVDTSGLIAVNYAPGSNRAAVYADGNSGQVNTGLALNLLGDSSTGMGTGSYQGQDSGDRGPALIYTDPGLPVNTAGGLGVSVEFWFIYGDPSVKCTLLSLWAPPSSFQQQAPPYTRGGVFNVNVNNGGKNQLNVGAGSAYVNVPGYKPAPTPQHLVITFPAGGGDLTVFLNGQETTVRAAVPVWESLRAVMLGPGRYSCDVTSAVPYDSYNFTAGHLAVYPYVLTPTRVANHYQAGASGWNGVTAPYRFAQILTWAGVGLKRGGLAPQGDLAEVTLISEAYDLEGSSAGDAVNTLQQSEGGQVFCQANGSLVYLQRWGAYNMAPQVTFGDAVDGAEVPFLNATSFDYDNTYLYDRVTSTQERGPVTAVEVYERNAAARARFFDRSALSFTQAVSSPYDVNDIVSWSAAKYSQPAMRVKQLQVDAASNPAQAFPAVLATGIGSVVNVNRRPLGGAPVTQQGIVQRVAHSIGPGVWRTTYQVSPYVPDDAVLETSGTGTLGTATLPW